LSFIYISIYPKFRNRNKRSSSLSHPKRQLLASFNKP